MSDGWNLREFLDEHDIPKGHRVVFLDHSYCHAHSYPHGDDLLPEPFEARCECGWRVLGDDRVARANEVLAHWEEPT